jgi:peptidoglycan/LPS O-acetylase OafA/YrhL
MQFLGAISYSLYLTHNPVVGAVSYVSRLWIGSDLLTLIFSVAASVGTAALFWRFVERPALALAHHVRLKPRYAAAPAAVAPTHSPPFNSDTRQALNHLPSGES